MCSFWAFWIIPDAFFEKVNRQFLRSMGIDHLEQFWVKTVQNLLCTGDLKFQIGRQCRSTGDAEGSSGFKTCFFSMKFVPM